MQVWHLAVLQIASNPSRFLSDLPYGAVPRIVRHSTGSTVTMARGKAWISFIRTVFLCQCLSTDRGDSPHLIGWRHGNRWQRSSGRIRPYRRILRSSQRTPRFVLLDCSGILCGSRNRNPPLRLAADSTQQIRTIAPDLPGDTFSDTCPPSSEHVMHPDWLKRDVGNGSRAFPVAHWWNGCARDRSFHVGRLRACARGVCRFVSIDGRCLFVSFELT